MNSTSSSSVRHGGPSHGHAGEALPAAAAGSDRGAGVYGYFGWRQANDTAYGLAASAWTRDVYRAQRASREIHAGCVWINDHIPIISEMPHGGFGASGFGKDMSQYSLEEYLSIKHVMSDITGVADKEWHRTVFAKR